MKNLFLIILTVFIVGATVKPGTAQGKKTALEVPSIFFPPKDDPRVKNLEEFNTQKVPNTVQRIDGIAWSVFSDRVGNVTDKGIELDFKDQFYVIEENENKIHIIQGSKNHRNQLRITVDRDFGWIEKGKMLLWNRALIHPISKINRKGFLLNKRESLDDIRNGEADKVLVNVMNTPAPVDKEKDIIAQKPIYEFVFILKKVQRATENDSLYLISKNIRINSFTSNDDIIGWVDSDRITDWNTRLALEPNFETAAYEEREANPEKQVKLFDEVESAIAYSKGKKISNEAVLWDHDPVSLSTDKVAESDPKRFPGNVIRFPLLSKDKDEGYYKTAVVSEITLAKLSNMSLDKIDIIDAAPFLDDIDRYIDAKRNVNIVYLIENSNNTKEYIDLISKSMLDISRNRLMRGKTIQYGAAFYGATNDFDYEPLSTSFENVIDFIKSKSTISSYQRALYDGLSQTLKKVGLKKNDNNIIVLIGSDGNNGQLASSSKDVERTLNKWSANLIALNCGTSSAATSFKQQLKIMLIETAKISSNKCRISWASLKHKDPDLVNNNLLNADFYGSYNEITNSNEMSEILGPEILRSVKFINNITGMLNKIFNEGKAVPEDMGEIDAAINRIVCEVANKNNLSQQDVKKLAYEKYELYLDAKTPIKVQSAKYNCFSNVLFLPKQDLVDLRDKLRSLVYSENSTPNKKRSDLRKAWIELLGIYTGETDPDNLSRYTIDDWIKIYTGLEGEDVNIGKESVLQGKSLDDIDDKDEVPTSDINAYIAQVARNYILLDNILKENRYDYSYTSNGNTYYWIPVEYLP